MQTNKRFTFVNLSIGTRTIGVNHGIAALVSIFKKHLYNVSVLNLTEELDEDDFYQNIEKLKPSIVGFSCTSHQYKYLIKYSKALKKNQEILQIAGGVHATLDPLGILTRTAVEGVCVGEGEMPVESLLTLIDDEKDITDAKGFFWKHNGTIKKNPIPQFVNDLSGLEFPDYSVFERDFVVRNWSIDRSLIVQKRDVKKYIEIMLSRGCPYNCHYCCNKALSSVYSSAQGYFRLPPVEYAIRFLEKTLALYQETEYIEFIDDLLIANKKWFMDFCKEYKKRINIPYRLCGRFELITPEITDALKNSGCIRILFGVESGDEALRKKYLNRNYSNELTIEKCRLIKEAGITICTLNIVGFPFEAKEQMQATLELNKKIAPEFGTCCFFHPYKGTELYNLCEKHGLLKGEEETINITSNYARPYIKLTNISEKECLKFQKKMLFYFFWQTFRYRIRIFNSSCKGLKKLLSIVIAIKLLAKGTKLYCTDYLFKFH